VLYRKNIYQWEQALRIIGGAAMVGWGLFLAGGGLLGYVVAASGAFLAVTGFVGWCPACAMVGRRLKE
jgi:hypothetical protein